MDGTKILSMVVENLHFLDFLNFLPMSLKSMPKSFGLNARGALHALLNMAENLDYVCLYPEPKLYGTEYISGAERASLLKLVHLS
jgi:hypothetical protein